MNSKRRKMKMGYGRRSLKFGVAIGPDTWRLIKRLHDVGASIEFEVCVRRGTEPVLLRATDFDLRGVSSAPFSTENEVLPQLAARAPGIRARRHPNADVRTLGDLFPGARSSIRVSPLPPPTPFLFTGAASANQV